MKKTVIVLTTLLFTSSLPAQKDTGLVSESATVVKQVIRTSSGTVSYTHLDVYKRQTQMNIPEKGNVQRDRGDC